MCDVCMCVCLCASVMIFNHNCVFDFLFLQLFYGTLISVTHTEGKRKGSRGELGENWSHLRTSYFAGGEGFAACWSM